MARDNAALGFLIRLRKDARGNTLAIMAAILIPLAGFSGSAIDMARLYVVKVRLQQACDAGALAGRKFMTDTNPATALDSTASTQATTFFDNNFQSNWFKTSDIKRTFTKTSDSQVAGNASTVVPMTIMKIFGIQPVTLSVTCQARFDVADTDVIFVLDTTGSMACLPGDDDTTCSNYVNNVVNRGQMVQYSRPGDSAIGQPWTDNTKTPASTTGSANDSVVGYPGSTAYYVPEKSGSRIAALRSAVVNFYQTMAANVDPTTHVRYGFVTYTSTVNAGKAVQEMSPSYMVGGTGNGTTTWNYQTRVQNGDSTSSSNKTYTNVSSSTCDGYKQAKTYNSNGTGTGATTSYSANNGSTTKGTCVVTTTTYTPKWTYKQAPQDVSSFVAGRTVTDPTKVTGATSQWTGCVEERDTEHGVTSFTSASYDLDPDKTPDADSTRWRPMWPEVVYARNGWTSTSNDSSTGDDTSDDPNLAMTSKLQSGFVSCGKPVHRLATMTMQDVYNYVNASDFRAIGGTYHDTGMIWGTRMLSPNGIFSNDTSAWPGRSAPNRVIVFLTDGDMAPSTQIYGMYGLEYFDKRVTNGDYNNIKDYHNARFLYECSKAKAMNIDVWTVSIAPSATSQMQSCATTTTQALYTTDGTGLSDAFKKIALQVAMLRLSK